LRQAVDGDEAGRRRSVAAVSAAATSAAAASDAEVHETIQCEAILLLDDGCDRGFGVTW
jgi:hypothetical protein